MKLRSKLIAATAAVTLATGVAAAPTANAQPSLEQSIENPTQASYELSVQSPLGVGSILVGQFVYFFAICPALEAVGYWDEPGRCAF